MLAAASADVVAADLRVSRLQDPLPEGQLRPRRISARRTPTSTVQVRRICSPNVEPYPPDGTGCVPGAPRESRPSRTAGTPSAFRLPTARCCRHTERGCRLIPSTERERRHAELDRLGRLDPGDQEHARTLHQSSRFQTVGDIRQVGTGPACWAGCQNRAAVGEACDGPREIPQQWFLARRSDFGPLSSAKRMPDKRSIERSSLKSPIASAAVCDPCTSSTD